MKIRIISVVEFNEEELYIAWGLYIEKLVDRIKIILHFQFQIGKIEIVDENCIEIITENNLQQKFIEAERGALIAHLQSHFNNRFLTYKVLVVENKNKNELRRKKSLTTKQQYLKIIEEYPLVKQLKDSWECNWIIRRCLGSTTITNFLIFLFFNYGRIN